MTAEEINQKIYEEITENILQNYDGSNGEEVIIKGEDDFIYRLTTTDNMFEDNNETIGLSKIDLGTCEDRLRSTYNLNEDISLIIISLEKDTNISSERNVQFEVYESLNKTRLDLSVCEDESIDIYIPLVLSEELTDLYNELKDLGYNLFDINDKFYTDICTPYKSQNGADILLSDRINYLFNNDETQCQAGCKFSTYSMETQNVKCECKVESSEINLKKGQNEGSKSLYKSFYDVLKYSNYKVLKCYKLAFRWINFKINLGFILVFIFFIIYLIFLFMYLIKGINQLRIDISRFLYVESQKKEVNSPIVIFKEPEKEKNEGMTNVFGLEGKRKTAKSINFTNPDFLKSSSKSINKKSSIDNKPRNTIVFPPKKSSCKSLVFQTNNLISVKDNTESNIKDQIPNNQKKSILKRNNEPKSLRKSSSDLLTNKIEEKLDNFELNNLDYILALKLDQRRFIDIYWSILKREHLIIFTFFIRNDHNILHIKLSRLVFLIVRDMALNVFFFADETMHTMYLDYGKYNFVQQIPQIIYSTIVSQIIEVFLCYLSYTDKHYYQIKSLNNENRYILFKILKCIKLKIAFFYVFTFIMFLFCWYTVTCFCAVYENTQIAYIKDSFTSFGLGLLYPFVLYLFPSIFRIISLRCCDGKLSFVYWLSDIIPIF